jgi:hypothetical protein
MMDKDAAQLQKLGACPYEASDISDAENIEKPGLLFRDMLQGSRMRASTMRAQA